MDTAHATVGAMRKVLLALVAVSVGAGWVLAHGGVGSPVLGPLQPGTGEIRDAVNGQVNLQWEDFDPDENASLRLMYTQDLSNPEATVDIVAGLPEDCDPSDGGPLFTGVLDGGPDASTPDQGTLDQMFCRNTVGGCTHESDCYAWDVTAMPPGNYFILGALDDIDYDSGVGAVSFRVSRGLVRIATPDANVHPALLIQEPDGVGDLVNTCYRVRWSDSDPDDDARVSMWIEPAFGGGARILVSDNISEDDLANGYDVDMSGAELSRDYAIIMEIDDGHNPPWLVRSDGFITRYVRRVDGGVVSQDGGCVGTAPAFPDGSAWPRDGGLVGPDGGSSSGSQDASTPSLDAGRMDASGASSTGGATSSSSGGSSGAGPNCRDNAQSPAGSAPWWTALVLVVVGRWLRRHR
jgi:hypothetical protein